MMNINGLHTARFGAVHQAYSNREAPIEHHAFWVTGSDINEYAALLSPESHDNGHKRRVDLFVNHQTELPTLEVSRAKGFKPLQLKPTSSPEDEFDQLASLVQVAKLDHQQTPLDKASLSKTIQQAKAVAWLQAAMAQSGPEIVLKTLVKAFPIQ